MNSLAKLLTVGKEVFKFDKFFQLKNLAFQEATPIPPPTCSGSLQGLPQGEVSEQDRVPQESLCSEMLRELCRALRCHASSRRRKGCEKCSTHVVGYPIDNTIPTPINGVSSAQTFYAIWKTCLINSRIKNFLI